MNVIHGLHRHPLYRRWIGINERCEKPTHHNYPRYGARGIKMCKEWRNSFPAFLEYVTNLKNYGERGYTLDRIDGDKGYEPGNLRWATQQTQTRNSRNARFVTYQDVTLRLVEWDEKLGFPKGTLKKRLFRNWSVERALTTRVQTKVIPDKNENEEGIWSDMEEA